jgi:hypothetical protein
MDNFRILDVEYLIYGCEINVLFKYVKEVASVDLRAIFEIYLLCFICSEDRRRKNYSFVNNRA